MRLCRLLVLAAVAISTLQLPNLALAQGAATTFSGSYPTVSPPTTIDDSRFGVVDAYLYPTAARASGAHWERVNFWWNEIQPDSSSEHMAPRTISDSQLKTELDAGMSVVGLLGNPPAWATRNGSTPANLYLPVTDPQNYWAAFVRLMVTTYAGRINQWIIWNEPDIPMGDIGSTWAGTVDEYYQLIKDAAEVAKAFNPDEKIVVAGTTYWSDIQHGSPLFIDRLAALDEADSTAASNGFYFDAVDMHVYSRAADVLKIAQIYHNVLQSHGIDRPLWLSETNVPPYDDPATPRNPDLTHDTMSEQANFIIEAFAYALAAGVARMSVYRIADTENDPSGPWGLLHLDGSPRPAFQAFETAAAYFSGATNVHLDRQPYLDTLTYDRASDKAWLYWATGQAPVQGTAPLMGATVTVVDKTGKSTPATVPTSGVEPPFTTPVTASASHSDDGSPQNTRVGGDPAFLIQGDIGSGMALADGSQYFPLSGHTVASPFLDYVLSHGGFAKFGQPVDQAHSISDGQTQDFQQLKVRTHPKFAESDYFLEQAPASSNFAIGAAYAPFSPAPAPPSGGDSEYFATTGHSVSGPFRRFFDSHGGLTVFGYPRTEPFQQQGWKVQWFQRAEFQFHPELAGTPYEVQLRLLGTELTNGRDFSPAPPPTATPAPTATPVATTTATPQGSSTKHSTPTAKGAASHSPTPTATPTPSPVKYFPQTGHNLGFGFLQFYNANGGLDAFGYPISEEIQEAGPDGKMGTIQYFQRARFEYHPEFAGTPYAVELGLLGDQYLGLP